MMKTGMLAATREIEAVAGRGRPESDPVVVERLKQLQDDAWTLQSLLVNLAPVTPDLPNQPHPHVDSIDDMKRAASLTS